MKKIILVFLLVTFSIVGYTQVIKGTILDQKTHDKISFAYIYFNGTFVGTNSDKNGNFELDISRYPLMPLTISALGYNSVTMNIVSYRIPIIVNLKPKVFELAEVVISGKAHNRERRENLRLFEDSFLGETRNARECEITNENDIIFISANDTLKAFSVNPILIDNKALGYKVSYFLDEFNYNKKDESCFFSGNIIFTEDLSMDKTKNLIFDSRRKHAYLGSRMHFFRSLWQNDLDSSKYSVKNPKLVNLTYANIVNVEDSLTKYLQYPEDLGICYHTSLPSTYIIFLESEVFFDKNGYFEPYGIRWQGEMARKRIADWLPYEYSIK